MLQFMGSKRVGDHLRTELKNNQKVSILLEKLLFKLDFFKGVLIFCL